MRLVAWEESLGSVFLLANPSVRPFLCPVPQGCLNIQVKKCAAASSVLLRVVLLFPQALHTSCIRGEEGRHFHRSRNAGLESPLTYANIGTEWTFRRAFCLGRLVPSVGDLRLESCVCHGSNRGALWLNILISASVMANRGNNKQETTFPPVRVSQ